MLGRILRIVKMVSDFRHYLDLNVFTKDIP
jgi:hypothetical protein